MSRNIVLQASGVSVAASLSDVEVSKRFDLPQYGPAHLKVVLSAATEGTGITFKLKDSYDGGATFFDVGSESQAALVKKTFTGGTAEVTAITWPATAAATQGDYVHVIAQDGTKYAVWLDIDAAGTAPTGALYVAADQKIKVSIVTGGSAAANAALARAAVVANSAWVADFTTSSVSTATFSATQINTGAVTDAAPKDANDGGAGSITTSVSTAGSDGGVVLATNRLTSTSHGWLTGQRVILNGSDVPAGLTTATTYYVIKVDANTLTLAESLDLAIAGTAVDITDYGSGTCTMVQADYEIRMIKEDSSDLAQMPFWSPLVVTCTTGSGDSCTVSAIYLSE